MSSPLYVYDNWSAYDELSDNVPLTEALSLRELEEILRLRRFGVRMDAYLMDAFWYEPDGGYYRWKKDRWPNGPDRWLQLCHESELKPGLWFPANTAFQMEVPEAWKDSISPDGWGFCCFSGGFMGGFIEVLSHWYSCGVRVFKFDFADFGAAPDSVRLELLPSEIRSKNVAAYRKALLEFRKECPEAILCAYNGFEEAEYMTWTDRPVRRVLDPGWLEVFDSIYCGDPRPSDLPLPNFWRTLDVYADHMVWYLNHCGMPLDRIDNCSFMIGETGTCYRRGKEGWKASLLLSLARGGRIHMTLGNLENLTDADAEWFAKAQNLFESGSSPDFIGGIPGNGEAYGYSTKASPTVISVVNPSLKAQSLRVAPGLSLVFSDGFAELDKDSVTLGPGAMAMLSSDESLRLGCGVEAITGGLQPLEVEWLEDGLSVGAEITLSTPGELHLTFRQLDANGRAVRTSGGPPPSGRTLDNLLRIQAWQMDHELEVVRPDDKAIWSGLSWAYGIVREYASNSPIRVRVGSTDSSVVRLTPAAFFCEHFL